MRLKNKFCIILGHALCILWQFVGSQAIADSSNPFLNSVQIQSISLKGPLQKFVQEGKADYQENGKKSKYFVAADLTVRFQEKDISLPVELSLRGQTSVQAMDFPKYKIKFQDKTHLLLGALDNLKVVSHGWETDSDTILGQGAGIRATPLGVYREAAVYDLLREAGLPIAQSRRAMITYQYTDQSKTITQPALLIETYKALGKRVGGVEIELLERTPEDLKKVAKNSLSARIWLAEMMIGNWDFAIPTEEIPEGDVHNVTLVRMDNGEIVPYVEDFNMASMVSMNIDLPDDIAMNFHSKKGTLFRSMLWNIASLKDEFSASQIKEAISYFVDRKDALLKKVESLEVDEKGRENIRNHLKTFFEIIAKPELILN